MLSIEELATAPSASLVPFVNPAVPEIGKLQPLLEEIWASGQFTNGGQFDQIFASDLREFLGKSKNVSTLCNGTLALIAALKASGCTGSVITTPFTFVATVQAILWAGLKPIFVDIAPGTPNLDPVEVEKAISSEVTAVLPVHVYGLPCDVERLESVSKQNKLKLIYDCAHGFGVKYLGSNLASFGDFSILSLHATKAFNSIEGGVVVSSNSGSHRFVEAFKNFGFADKAGSSQLLGLNAKMNEIQAAVGLLNLRNYEKECESRRHVYLEYRAQLEGLQNIEFFNVDHIDSYNYSYLPIVLEGGRDRLKRLETKLKRIGVVSKRYFNELVTAMPFIKDFDHEIVGSLEHAQRLAQATLCLPLHKGVSSIDIRKIVSVVSRC